MAFQEELCQLMESIESESVGSSFGGQAGSRKSFSVPQIRDWIIGRGLFSGDSVIENTLNDLGKLLPSNLMKYVLGSAVRFSFLIELTDLKVGSTKMKTRWVPGLILMPQEGSFEPKRDYFQPGNDPRSASFEECLNVFENYCAILINELNADESLTEFITNITQYRRVPYEFPFGYRDPHAEPVHKADNLRWILNDDIRWLVKARKILRDVPEPDNAALRQIEAKKLEVKVYKTDRALTGKDKTNRAKRWEVLAGDFQHAALDECWSVERKLTQDLVHFEQFPVSISEKFQEKDILAHPGQVTRCPVTLTPLNYPAFAASMLNTTHGRSDYQIGHLIPLKRGGRHTGENVCWQSADGNRIQGDLSLQETEDLLDAIATRRKALLASHAAVSE